VSCPTPVTDPTETGEISFQTHSDSLEAALRTLNTPDSLPIFTLADAKRVLRDREYAERVADQFLEYLYDIPRLLGAGRMYLP